jgi:peptidoglycan/LPS O-acetylase OafA/YrhL
MSAAAPAASAAARPALYIPSLDGIRACAVMLVFAAHATKVGLIPGEFGVTVFFFLSGYLITTLLRIEQKQHGGSFSFRAFYLRRVLRIFPPFYLVLFVASLVWVLGIEGGPKQVAPFSLGGLLAQMAFLTNYQVIVSGWWLNHAPGTWIFWSLAVEEHFYLLFPLLYFLLLRWVPSQYRQAMILGGLCALVLVWRIVLVAHLTPAYAKDRVYVATDTRIDSILFGCILAVFGNPLLDRTLIREQTWKYLLVPLALAGLVVSFVIRNLWFQETVAYTLQGLCLFPLFIAAIRYPTWGPYLLVNLRPVKFIGLLSYSIYLMHPAVLYAFQLHISTLRAGVVALVAVIGLAWVMYEVVEKPAARLRKRLSRILVPGRPAPAPATPAPAATPVRA